MLHLVYVGEKDNKYAVDFMQVNDHVVQITGDFPVKGNGFTLSRIGFEDGWDYTEFRTVYKNVDGGAQFSNDGSVYVATPAPAPIPTPEPIEITLEEEIEMKVEEMNTEQQMVIQNGIDVTLTDGSVEHFTLSDQDQTSLMGLQVQVAQGVESIPWHTSDQSVHCKYYSNADMTLIVTAAMQFVTYHVTYFRDLRIYIRSLKSKDKVEAVAYGMEIPVKYQSQPLKDMQTSMGTNVKEG